MKEVFLQHHSRGFWQRFHSPEQTIEAHTPEEVLPALARIERLVEENAWYAVGFVTYDAAPGFDCALRVVSSGAAASLPLLSFGLYTAPEILHASRLFPDPQSIKQPSVQTSAQNWCPSVDRAAYDQALDTIREHIIRGNTYQVNYTWRLRQRITGDPLLWFASMMGMTQHAAYLDTGRFVILSASPELFFSLEGRSLITRPMKGTAPRDPDPLTDRLRAETLQTSRKDRAENVMIVDMMRNDLSRIAELGSVQVSRLFALERYSTVWQMTSTVEANTRASVTEIFRALFPAASVTGAPKANTMKLIAGLETTPRGLYTGAIGFMAPRRRAEFSVAIRTAILDRTTGVVEYGVGGGIVWDSEKNAEYAECLAKAQVLWSHRPRFALLETLLWTPVEGFSLLEEHIDRISESARYFGYPLDPPTLRHALTQVALVLPPLPHRVRLLLDDAGHLQTEYAILADQGIDQAADPPTEVSLMIATQAIDSRDPFFYHKTTHRVGYDRIRSASPEGDDVLLWNERGEITETTRANVVIERNGERITPPVSAGLLAGTYRRTLLAQGVIREGTILLSELSQGSVVWLINSVRGWRRAIVL